MSFLTEAAARRMVAVSRTTLVSSAPRAAFSSTVQLQKTAAETAKDKLKDVDRAVADKIVDGINIGSTITNKMKEAAEDITQGKATGQASKLRGEAEGKASEVAGEAKGTASEMAGKAKGAAGEAAGKAKGAAEEVQKKL